MLESLRCVIECLHPFGKTVARRSSILLASTRFHFPSTRSGRAHDLLLPAASSTRVLRGLLLLVPLLRARGRRFSQSSPDSDAGGRKTVQFARPAAAHSTPASADHGGTRWSCPRCRLT